MGPFALFRKCVLSHVRSAPGSGRLLGMRTQILTVSGKTLMGRGPTSDSGRSAKKTSESATSRLSRDVEDLSENDLGRIRQPEEGSRLDVVPAASSNWKDACCYLVDVA